MTSSRIAKRVFVAAALGVLLVVAGVLLGCGNDHVKFPLFLVAPGRTAGAHVDVFSVNPSTGALTAIAASTPNPVDMGLTTPVTIITHPTIPSILFVNDNTTQAVTPLTINATGKLTKGTLSTPLTATATGFFPSSMTITPNGGCLYVADGQGLAVPKVGIFTVGANGALTFVADQTIANVTAGSGIVSLTATNSNLYMVSGGFIPGQLITVPITTGTCALGAAGAPAALGAACTTYNFGGGDVGAGPTTIALDSTATHVFVGDTTGLVAGYTLDAAGTHFTARSQAAVTAGAGVFGWVNSIAFSPDGKFVYFSTTTATHGLTAFNYNSSAGTLGAEITTPAPLGATATGGGCLVLDRTNSLIYNAQASAGAPVAGGATFHGYTRNATTGTLGTEQTFTPSANVTCVALTH